MVALRVFGRGWKYSQFSHVLGNAFGEGVQPPVAAPHHRLQAGALLGAARAQLAATLVVACEEPQSEQGGRLTSLGGRGQVSEAWCQGVSHLQEREALHFEPE